MGGTLEFINAGIPIICFPHFGDQSINTEILRDRGVAIPLMDPKKAVGGFKENFPKPMFDAEKVHDSLKALFTE